jgi:hypothetical protein
MHGTLHQQFDASWPTYTGGRPDRKPEKLETEIEKGHAPRLEDFIAAFGAWVQRYNATVQPDMGGSPDEIYAANLDKKRVMPREQLDFHFLRRVQAKVHRNGVRYHGLNYGQYELGHLQGREVYLRVDDGDLTKVSVWDEKDRRFLGLAKANERIPEGANRELLRAAMARKRHYIKALKNAEPARRHIHEDIPDIMAELERERVERLAQQREKVACHPTLEVVQSPLAGELPKLARAAALLQPPTREEAAEMRKTRELMMQALEESWEKRQEEQAAEAEARPRINLWEIYGGQMGGAA